MSRKRRFPRIIGLFLALTALLLGIGACSSTKTYPSVCGYIVGNGAGDDHKVKKVLLPSESAGNTFDGDDKFYVPCGARNYRFAPGSNDVDIPVNVVAGGNEVAGTKVSIRLTAHFQLNQNRDALKEFFTYCQKYPCYSDDPESLAGNDDDSATPGWRNLLNENMRDAVVRDARTVLATFPADVWANSSQYDEIATKMSAGFAPELRRSLGQPESSKYDFFCAVGATEQTCDPVTFTIEGINTTDQSVEQRYYDLQNQLNLKQQQGRLLDQDAENARKQADLYAQPGYAQERQIEACTDNAVRATCVFGGGNVTVQVPASPAPAPAG